MRGLLIFCSLFLAGCGQPPSLPKDVVARVNNYMITAGEFKHDLDGSLAVFKNYPDISPALVKEKILDEMIVNELLLEEAQKLNFDKQEAFMREVEGYWRQALLKAILQEKNREFLAGVAVPDATLRALYAREGEQLELTITYLVDEAAAKEMSGAGDGAIAVQEKLGARILRQETGWWMSGDFPALVEASVWGLKTGEVSQPLFIPQDGWVVMKVVSKEVIRQKPFEAVAPDLRKRASVQSAQVMIDGWVAALRAKAQIVKAQQVIDRVAFSTQEGVRDDK